MNKKNKKILEKVEKNISEDEDESNKQMIQKKKEEINMNKIEKKEITINTINSNNVIQLNEKKRRDILDESKLYIHDENKSKYYPESNNSGDNKTSNNSVVLGFFNASESSTKQDIENGHLNSEIEKDSKEIENNILIKSQNEIKSGADNIYLNKKLTNGQI